jgi:hypothetical protein
MAGKHVIKQGEDLHSVCRKYGLTAEKFEGFGANSELWSKTRDSEILHPGDHLELPEVEAKSEAAKTESRTRFRAKFQGKVEIVLRLVDIEGPRSSLDYELDVDGLLIQGQTDGDGQLRAKIPIDAHSATLTVASTGEVYAVRIAHLNPIATLSGAKQRLNHLGYFDGEIDESESADFNLALCRFQEDQDLTVSGQYDDPTRSKLVAEHGC